MKAHDILYERIPEHECYSTDDCPNWGGSCVKCAILRRNDDGTYTKEIATPGLRDAFLAHRLEGWPFLAPSIPSK